MRRVIWICVLQLCIYANVCADTSGYSGEQLRQIKSLSLSEIQGYLSGKGMGMAKAAELNHYPGPRQVLDLEQALGLTGDQLRKSQMLYKNMNHAAANLGEQIINEEKLLDKLFAEKDIDSESLRTRVDRIAKLQGELRFIHLNAHLEQKKILTMEQIEKYDEMRGYGVKYKDVSGNDVSENHANRHPAHSHIPEKSHHPDTE